MILGIPLQNRIGRVARVPSTRVNVLPLDACPDLHGCRTRLEILGAGSVDDVTFCYRGDLAAGLVMQVDATTALYTVEATVIHAHRLAHFLEIALDAQRLADVPTLTPDEMQAHVHDRNATAHEVPDTTLSALIEEGMRANPEAPALIFGDTTLSHARLEAETRAFARRLATLGIGPGDIVAVALPRSVDLVVALVGILRAGAAFLPLDPEDHSARRDGILTHSEPVAVIAGSGFTAGDLPVIRARAEGPEAEPAPVTPGDPAYVLFTSGSG